MDGVSEAVNVELFRQEVLDARRADKLGGIKIVPPKAGWFFFLGALFVLFALVLIGFLGRYARTESVAGRLVPESGMATVVAPNSARGVIASVLVHDGEVVKKGQPLLKISDQRTSASLGDTGQILSDQLARKLAELKESVESQRNLSLLKQSELGNRTDFLKQRIERLAEQINSQEQRYQAAKELYDTWHSRAAEVISGYQISQQYDTVLQQKSQVDSLRDQRIQVLADLAQAKSEMAQLPDATRERIASLSAQIADVQGEIAENEVARELVIRSPGDGVVSGLLVHPGQPVSGTLPLLFVLPENGRLVAELWVPSRSVGLLKIGDQVDIEYTAFPAQRFGSQHGEILGISTSALSATELGALLGSSEHESAYRVLVETSSGRLPKSLSQSQLKAGMSLAAKIQVEDRKLIEWIIWPREQVASRLPERVVGESNG